MYKLILNGEEVTLYYFSRYTVDIIWVFDICGNTTHIYVVDK